MAKIVVDGCIGNSNGFQDFVIEGENLKDCASKLIEQTNGSCTSGVLMAFSQDGKDVSDVSDELSGIINSMDKE